MPPEAKAGFSSMPDSPDNPVHVDYRLLNRDWIEDCDLFVEPHPGRLRTACLMVYAGLLLSLAAFLSSPPAMARSTGPEDVQLGAVHGFEQHAVRVAVPAPHPFSRRRATVGPSSFDGICLRYCDGLKSPELSASRISLSTALRDG